MLTITPAHQIYVACHAFDFRMGIDGFVAVCKKYFNLDPFLGYCFIFRNKRRTAIKVLLYHNAGFWLCHKRLSKGQFKQWPKEPTNVVMIDTYQLSLLLQQ